MASSTNTNSSNMNSSLNYRHAGRTWKLAPFNLVKHALITPPVFSDSWVHLVFTLNKKHLRNSAIGFDQFREDAPSQSMLKIFAFFLKLCDIQCTEGTTQKHLDVAVLLEWVKSANSNKHVGIRLHLFSNRKGKAAKPFNIVCKILADNGAFSERNDRTFVKNTMPWDAYKSITNYHEYAAQICDPYSKHHRASSALDDTKYFLETHAANPIKVFSIDSDSFEIQGACELQNSVDNYKQGNSFVFPDCNRIYRLFPSDLHLDKFFHKYLPDYFFTRAKHPDCMSYPSEEGDNNVRTVKMYIADHLEREKHIHFLDNLSINKNEVEDTWTFKLSDKEKVIELIQSDYNCYHSNDESVEVGATNAGENFITVTSRLYNMEFQTNSLTADSAKIISPLIETQLTNKHSLSDLDILRIQGQHRRKYVTDRRKFQEDMISSFVERVWDDTHADVSEPARMMLLWKSNLRDPSLLQCNFKKIDPSMSVFANRAIRVMDFFDTSLFVSAQHKTLFLLNHSKYDAYREVPNLHFNQTYTGEGATSKSFLFEMMELLGIPNTVQTLTYQTTRADAIDGDRNDTICVFNEAPPGMFITNKNVDTTQEAMFKEKLTSMTVKVKEFWRDESTGERKNRIAKSQAIGVVMGATNDDPSTCSEAMTTRFYWGQFEKYSEGRSIQECMRGDRDLQDCEAARHDKAQWIEYFREEQMRMWLVFKFIYMEILHAPSLKAADIVYAEVTTILKRKYKVNIPPRTKERYEILCTIYTIINALETVFNIEGGLHNGKAFHPMLLLDIEPLLYCTEEIAVFALTQISEEIVNPNEFKVLKAIWELHKKSGEYREEVHTTDDGKRITTPDYNYIRLNNGKRLLTEIINQIPPTAGKMSKHNIKGILNDFSDRCNECPIYQEAGQIMGGHRKFNDLYPEPIEGNRDKKITLIREERSTLIHIHQFANVRTNKYENVIKEALRSLEHKFAEPTRKYLMGSSIREMAIVKYPNVLDTITLNKKESKVISLSNPLYKDKRKQGISRQTAFDKKQLRKRDSIKRDLTTHAAIHHALILGKTKQYAKQYMEKYNDFGVESYTIDYPKTLIAPTEDMEELTMDESSSDDEDDFDSMEVVPMLTRLSKRPRLE